MGHQPAQQRRPVPDRLLLADAMGLEKRFLHDVLAVGGMAQNAPGDAEHHRPVFADDPIPIDHVATPRLATDERGGTQMEIHWNLRASVSICGHSVPRQQSLRYQISRRMSPRCYLSICKKCKLD